MDKHMYNVHYLRTVNSETMIKLQVKKVNILVIVNVTNNNTNYLLIARLLKNVKFSP